MAAMNYSELIKIGFYIFFLIFTTYKGLGGMYRRYIVIHLENKEKYKHLKETDYLKYQFHTFLKSIFLSVRKYEVFVAVGVWYLSRVFINDALHGNASYIQKVNGIFDMQVLIFVTLILVFVELYWEASRKKNEG